jgi:hypothetical protein
MGAIVDPNSNHATADNYALVTGTTVINVIVASWNDVQAILSTYDYLVDITVGGQNAQIGYTYDPVHDTFSAPPPPPPTLSEAKATLVAQFQSDWVNYVTSYYDQPTQLSFLLAQFIAKQNADIAQQLYISPLLTWLYTVNVYQGQTIAAINALTTVDLVNAYTYNIAGSTGIVPLITIQGVYAAG